MAGEKKVKRKGLGGLTPEKKRLLKQLIMQKAAEDLMKKHAEESEAKKKIIEARVPALQIDGMSQELLQKTVTDMYHVMCRLENDKYDWELKLRRQTFEINELTIKVNDIKGKFARPVLKKVSKTESKLAKLDKGGLSSKLGFRDSLKSTGQSKYALEDKEEKKNPEWGRDALKHKEGEEGDENDESTPETAAANADTPAPATAAEPAKTAAAVEPAAKKAEEKAASSEEEESSEEESSEEEEE